MIGVVEHPFDLRHFLEDGRLDVCDSCPDMTVWQGNLINSCRMDEYRLFGGLLSVQDRTEQEAEV